MTTHLLHVNKCVLNEMCVTNSADYLLRTPANFNIWNALEQSIVESKATNKIGWTIQWLIKEISFLRKK